MDEEFKKGGSPAIKPTLPFAKKARLINFLIVFKFSDSDT
jgi:hypothetical protein